MKLLCCSISEDDVGERSQVQDDFTKSLERNDIVEMLDNPDYPSHLRVKLLFDSSFQRLSAQEKEALVSLSVLPDSFDPKVAAAVLGISQIQSAKKILQTLRRRSFPDLGSKSGLFTIHKLLQSFARERGELEMSERILDAKSRLRASKQRALHIRLKLFGGEHSSTADSYLSLGVTQHEQGDFSSALHSMMLGLSCLEKHTRV